MKIISTDATVISSDRVILAKSVLVVKHGEKVSIGFCDYELSELSVSRYAITHLKLKWFAIL